MLCWADYRREQKMADILLPKELSLTPALPKQSCTEYYHNSDQLKTSKLQK